MSQENCLFVHSEFHAKSSVFSQPPEMHKIISSFTIFKADDVCSYGLLNWRLLKGVCCIFHNKSSLCGCLYDSVVLSCLSNFYHIHSKKIVLKCSILKYKLKIVFDLNILSLLL